MVLWFSSMFPHVFIRTEDNPVYIVRLLQEVGLRWVFEEQQLWLL